MVTDEGGDGNRNEDGYEEGDIRLLGFRKGRRQKQRGSVTETVTDIVDETKTVETERVK